MKNDGSAGPGPGGWRVALIGCGRVGAMHARHLAAQPLCSLAAVIDTDLGAARQMAERYRVPHVFSSIQEACKEIELDAAHVATPPFNHEEIGGDCLRLGLHVLMEKPMALSADAVERLYALAAENGVLLAPDYNLLFHPQFLTIEKWLAEGRLGTLRGVDLLCHYGFDKEALRQAASPPWPFELPGGWLHNYLTHPLYLASRLVGGVKRLRTTYEATGTLPQEITDSLVVVAEGERGTATIRLSLATEMTSLALTVYGSHATARAELLAFLSQLHSSSRLPGAVSRVLDPIRLSAGTVAATLRNVWRYVTGRLVPYEGLKILIEEFYKAAAGIRETPIPKELAIEVSRLEEQIVSEGGKWRLDTADRVLPPSSQGEQPVLVTGGSGYLGRRVVERLRGRGSPVRALVRFQSDRSALEALGASTVVGDVREWPSVERAGEGVCGVIHLAATGKGPREQVVEASVLGAQNVVRLARERELPRNIHISSFSVFDYGEVRKSGRIVDDTRLEEKVSERSAYSEAKILAERVVAEANIAEPRWLIIRPSSIFGGGRSLLSLLGTRIGKWRLVYGARSSPLRVIHVDDIANMIVDAWEAEDFGAGKAVNVSHPDRISLGTIAKLIDPRTGYRLIFLGRSAGHVLGALTRLMYRIIRRGPNLNRRQVDYLFTSAAADPEYLIQRGWAPEVDLCAQLREEIEFHTTLAGAGDHAVRGMIQAPGMLAASGDRPH
jgi:2-alkyl-3-oxoalkanoate reductase